MLDAVINLKDNFSSTLEQVEKNIGGFSRTAKNMGRDIQKTGRGLQSFGGNLTKGITLPIAGAVTASVKAYADFEQAIGGIETMFESSTDTVVKNSQTAYKRAGVSGVSYMEQVTSFSARLLQGLGGDTIKAAQLSDTAMVDMADNANKFGTNIVDIQNAYQGFAKNNFTMLDNLKLGYGGTATEMARLINESGVLGDTFEATAENVSDIPFHTMIEAIHQVQTEMGVTGTTAQEAEETISGSWGMMKASVKDFLAGLGSADADIGQLTDNIIESFGFLKDNVIDAIKQIWDNLPLTQFQKTMGAIAIAAGPVMLVLGKLTSGIGKVVFAFGEFAGAVKAKGLFAAIFTPGMKVVLVLAAIAGAVALVIKNWDKIKETLPKVGQAILDFLGITEGDLAGWIEFFGNIGERVKEVGSGIGEAFGRLKDTVGESIGRILESLTPIIDFLGPILGFIVGIFVMGVINAFATLGYAVGGAINFIAGVIENLLLILSGIIDFVVGVFTGNWELAWSGIASIFTGVVGLLETAWNGLVDLLSAPVEAFIDILSDSFHEKANKVRETWSSIKAFLSSPIQGTVNLVQKGVNWLGGKLGIGQNYAGTNYWKGGLTSIHERGGEIIDLPRGSRVYPHDKSVQMAKGLKFCKFLGCDIGDLVEIKKIEYPFKDTLLGLFL